MSGTPSLLYPKQTFLDYNEIVKFVKEPDYSDTSSTNTGWSANDSLDYNDENRKIHSVENFQLYSHQTSPNYPKKTHSMSDLSQLQFSSNYIQSAERAAKGGSFSNHQHLNSLILNGTTNSGFMLKKKPSETDFKVKYKTEVCRYWESKGTCPFGLQCSFAHGKQEMRSKALAITNYRTKKCIQFHEAMYCHYGNRCQFLHSIRGSANFQNMNSHLQEDCFQRQMENPEILLMVNSSGSECTCLRKFLRPRLPVFQEITRNSKCQSEEQ